MDSAVFQTEKQSHSTCGPDFDLHLEILPYKVLGGTVEDFEHRWPRQKTKIFKTYLTLGLMAYICNPSTWGSEAKDRSYKEFTNSDMISLNVCFLTSFSYKILKIYTIWLFVMYNMHYKMGH